MAGDASLSGLRRGIRMGGRGRLPEPARGSAPDPFFPLRRGQERASVCVMASQIISGVTG